MCTFAFILWAIFGDPGTRLFAIVSSAMAPTLVIGDYVVMAPAYGAGGAAPQRGEVAMFRDPRDPSTLHNFRVVGLPGDAIRMTGGILFINGAAVPRESLGPYSLEDGIGGQVTVERHRETLPGGKTHATLDVVPDGFLDTTAVFEVPEGHYFVLGDNRDNASDSRLVNHVGFVPRDHFAGRVDTVLCSRSDNGALRPERILTAVDR